MDLGEMGWGDVDWIGLAKDRDNYRDLVKAILNIHNKLWNQYALPKRQ
jgi:hypothetical protein